MWLNYSLNNWGKDFFFLFTFSFPSPLLLSLFQAGILSVPKGGSRGCKAPGSFISSLLIGLIQEKKQLVHRIYRILTDGLNTSERLNSYMVHILMNMAAFLQTEQMFQAPWFVEVSWFSAEPVWRFVWHWFKSNCFFMPQKSCCWWQKEHKLIFVMHWGDEPTEHVYVYNSSMDLPLCPPCFASLT